LQAAGEDDDCQHETFDPAYSEISATHAWRAKRWDEIAIEELSVAERQAVIVQAAARFRKSISPRHVDRLIGHSLAGRPLFLIALVDELRFSSDHKRLDQRLDYYLSAPGLSDLFSRVLERLEGDCAPDLAANAFRLISCSRAGVEEPELQSALRATQLDWSPFVLQAGNLVRTGGGRLSAGSSALHEACVERYLSSPLLERGVRTALAALYRLEDDPERAAEETPWQLRHAQSWDELEAVLTDPKWWPALFSRGFPELLEHWLALKAVGRDLETLLCNAWRSRPGLRNSDEDLALGTSLCSFLGFAGAIGEAALKLHLDLLEQSRRRHGPASAAALDQMRRTALLYEARGDLHEAEDQLRKTHELQRRNLGADHAATAASAIDLARISGGRRQYVEAEDIARGAVQSLLRAKGEADADTIAAQRTLADILAHAGKTEEASRMRRSLLERSRSLYGEEHPDTLAAMEAHVDTLTSRGDLIEAKYDARTVLKARERLFGLSHPLTLSSAVVLALALLRLDDRDARPLLDYAIEQLKSALGREHPLTLTVLQRLAERLVVSRQNAAAAALLEKIHDGRIRALGANHPDTLESGHLLAWALFGNRDLDRAEQVRRRLDKASNKKSMPSHAGRAPDLLAQIAAARRDPSVVDRYLNRGLAYGPALGVKFDIDTLNASEYDRVAFRVLFDSIPPTFLVNTRWRNGDTRATLAGIPPRTYVIAIEAAGGPQIDRIRTAIDAIRHPALGPGQSRFMDASALKGEPLVVTMRIGDAGAPDWAGGGCPALEEWCAARDAREGGAEGVAW
jgi:tetratricopeptide (TPR) repeat protein